MKLDLGTPCFVQHKDRRTQFPNPQRLHPEAHEYGSTETSLSAGSLESAPQTSLAVAVSTAENTASSDNAHVRLGLVE
jgi:hypothetical protein